MAFNFYGVYFETVDGVEYRCGYQNDTQYMPILERRDGTTWTEVNHHHGTGNAGETCRFIRSELPVHINFPDSHTQNERMELINQMIYNMNRMTTEKVNYRGAHS